MCWGIELMAVAQLGARVNVPSSNLIQEHCHVLSIGAIKSTDTGYLCFIHDLGTD
jgi:hypothetical protein